MAHIAIIGAGAVGLSVAYRATQRGHSVTGIDRHPARCDGCLVGNAGLVVPSHFAQRPELDFGLVQAGLLMLCQTKHTLAGDARTAEQARALGLPAEALNAAETAARVPHVTMKIAGSVYFP